MWTSAEPRRAQAGFTLLEIMATVALVGLVILPLLEVRAQANARAYNASRMVLAMGYAEALLVDCMLTADEYHDYEAGVEEDPSFRYILSLEEFDLSTGLTPDEADERAAQEGQDPASAAYVPGDAGDTTGFDEEDEEEDREDFHSVRRYRIRVLWPSWDGDAEGEAAWDSIDLEGYLPMVWEQEQDLEDEESDS